MIYDGHQAVLTMTGHEGLAHLLDEMADVAVIVLGTGDYDGLTLCRRLRARSDLPVLLVGNEGTTAEAVAGLEAGADDYLAPPADLAEVQARVKALLRRVRRGGPRPTVFCFADLTLNTATRTVTRADRPIRLTALEFDLLALFLSHQEVVLSPGFLLDRVWRHPANVANLEGAVHELRAKLEAAGEPRLIQTIRGAGYALRAELTRSA